MVGKIIQQIQVGDKVMSLWKNDKTYKLKGICVNIVEDESIFYASIDFGQDFDGHRCNGKLYLSTGWDINTKYLLKLNNYNNIWEWVE